MIINDHSCKILYVIYQFTLPSYAVKVSPVLSLAYNTMYTLTFHNPFGENVISILNNLDSYKISKNAGVLSGFNIFAY